MHVLMCYSFSALFTFHSTMYFMLTNRYRSPRRFRGIRFWIRGLGTLILILTGIGFGLFFLYLGAIAIFEPFGGFSLVVVPFLYLIFGIPVICQLLLAPWFGIYCYRNQEIES
jgi:hypothetical protein